MRIFNVKTHINFYLLWLYGSCTCWAKLKWVYLANKGWQIWMFKILRQYQLLKCFHVMDSKGAHLIGTRLVSKMLSIFLIAGSSEWWGYFWVISPADYTLKFLFLQKSIGFLYKIIDWRHPIGSFIPFWKLCVPKMWLFIRLK